MLLLVIAASLKSRGERRLNILMVWFEAHNVADTPIKQRKEIHMPTRLHCQAASDL